LSPRICASSSEAFTLNIAAMPSSSLWPRFQKYFLRYDDLDFSIDISRMEGLRRHARA
jgi:hypothetical protein